VLVLGADRGIVKVLGDAGTGKPTLGRRLRRSLRDRFTVVRSRDPSVLPDVMRVALADALRVPVDRSRPGELAAAVRDRIGALHDAGRPVLLPIDDADAMPAPNLVALRLLAQPDLSGEVVRIVLLSLSPGADPAGGGGSRSGRSAVRRTMSP
jgi:MSHA biogenesis protein MshM